MPADSRWTIIVAPLVVAGSFLAALWLPAFLPQVAATSIAVVLAAAVIVVTVAVVIAAHRTHGIRPSLRLAFTPASVVIAGAAYLLLVEGVIARYALVAVVATLVGMFMAALDDLLDANGLGAHREDFLHFSFALHVIAAFFLLAFLFGLQTFAEVPLPITAAAAGVLLAAIAAESLSRAGKSGKDAALLAGSLGVVSAEFYVALSFLPTTYLVDAAVGVILFAAALHLAAGVSTDGSRNPLRRHTALIVSLLALVLGTAQWS